MNFNRKLIISTGTILAGTLLTAGLIALVIKSGTAYFRKIQESEIRNAIAIDDALLKTQSGIDSGGDVSPYFKVMNNLDPQKMSAEQKLKYNILWGDLYIIRFRESVQEKVRQIFFSRAIRQYNIAAQMASSPELRSSLIRRNAALNTENGNWRNAIDLYEEAYPLINVPNERWTTDLELARCYLKIDAIAPALNRLEKAAGSDNPEIWGAAVIEKANLFLSAASQPKIREQLIKIMKNQDKALIEAAKKQQLPAYFKARAAAIYQDVEARLPMVDRIYSMAQLGMIRLAAMDNNSAEAFRLTNRMISGPAAKDDKVRAVLLLAEMEERRERVQEAIALVKKALQKYPIEASRLNAGLVLYNLYKKIKNWDAAFSIARNLFQRTSDPEAICKLIHDFSSGKNMIFDIIINSSDKEYYIKQLTEIYTVLQENHPFEWKQVRINAYYILAQLYYVCDEFEKAQNALNFCYLYNDNPDLVDEKVLRLDLMCAVKIKASPVLVISRARRYLNRYPRGGYYREALLELLRCYYDMGLYQPALQISRKIYADELDTASDRVSRPRDDLWMETIAMISQCYYRLGDKAKAAMLLRNFAQQLLKEKYGAKVYYLWAQMAIDQEQNMEALRRLDVALMYTTDPATKLKLQVAQSMLLMNTGSLKDFFGAGQLLRDIEKAPLLTRNQKEAYKRELCESMLEYADRNRMTREFDQILSAVMKKDVSRLWSQYWVLKALSPLFQTASLQALDRKHEEVLKSDYLKIIDDKRTYEFIREQLMLIRSLIGIEEKMEELKNKG